MTSDCNILAQEEKMLAWLPQDGMTDCLCDCPVCWDSAGSKQVGYFQALFGLHLQCGAVMNHSSLCTSQAGCANCINCSLEGSQLSWESLREQLTYSRLRFSSLKPTANIVENNYTFKRRLTVL